MKCRGLKTVVRLEKFTLSNFKKWQVMHFYPLTKNELPKTNKDVSFEKFTPSILKNLWQVIHFATLPKRYRIENDRPL